MNTSVNNPATMNTNAAAMVASNNTNNAQKIDDFGQKIGGARKDLYAAANEWAAQLAEITAEKLAAVSGVSKLVRLPNLEKLAEGGAITAEQARAAFMIWRGIERKPQGNYRAERWANNTRARLEALAAVITNNEPNEKAAEIIRAAVACSEYKVLTAANWPAVPFSFGRYSVYTYQYTDGPKMRVGDSRYYKSAPTADPAAIVARLRELVADDEQAAAERRAAGPRLGVYWLRHELKYYIAPADRCEIVLKSFDTSDEAAAYLNDHRAELVERYEALKKFPECRREWNRPRIGEEWRKGENMTPDTFAAVLPFRGVEFGNWVNQTERAALLNSAFDGFHDLAAVLNIAPAAVTLNGSLAFAFASRGHSGAAAHYEPARRVINLTKRAGAGCMAHEWWHAVDNFAAGGGVHNYATENPRHAAAFAILEAIKKTDYYTRSNNLANFKNADYWVTGRELTARAFEGVIMALLDAAGICSDFLANVKGFDEFTAEDVAHRSDFYPYPTRDEAAALVPFFVAFLREVFGDVLTVPAAIMAEAEAAAARIDAEKAEAERIRKEKEAAAAARMKAEAERRAKERAAKQAAEAEELKRNAAAAVAAVVETLTAYHFDTIATAYDSATVYAVGHLEGEIYTLSADIKTATAEGRAYIETRPACVYRFKRCHNAKRIICRRDEIKANKWNARELVESLKDEREAVEVRNLCRAYEYAAKVEAWQHAAKIYADTQRARAERAEKPANSEKPAKGNNTPQSNADGLTMEQYSEKATVIRGYNEQQRAELLEMGGRENYRLQGGKGVIFSTKRHGEALAEWVKAQTATAAPAAVADDTTAPTLQDAGEISAPAVVGVPDWLTVGATVRTAGRFLTDARTGRPVWVEGEEMTVTAIKPDFVELEKRDESGSLCGVSSVATSSAADYLTPVLYEAPEMEETTPATAADRLGAAVKEWAANDYSENHHGATLTDWDKEHPAPVEWCKPGQCFKLNREIAGRDIYGIITKLGNDCFFYVGNFGNNNEHLSAYNCQRWENLEPVNILHEDTPQFAKMFAKFHDIRKAWESEGVKVWEAREAQERQTVAPLYAPAESEESEPLAIAASLSTNDEPAPAFSPIARHPEGYTRLYRKPIAAELAPFCHVGQFVKIGMARKGCIYKITAIDLEANTYTLLDSMREEHTSPFVENLLHYVRISNPQPEKVPEWIKPGAKAKDTANGEKFTVIDTIPGSDESNPICVVCQATDGYEEWRYLWSIEPDLDDENAAFYSEVEKLSEPETKEGEEWRFVINSKGDTYADAFDLPAFITLAEAKSSNHLQPAYYDEESGQVVAYTHVLYEYCKQGDEGTNKIAYGQTEAQARWNYENGFSGIYHAEAQKPAWLQVGTVFCLVDHVTQKPTKTRYTCTAIDEERHTITVPEASDSFRNGSHEFSWCWHWPQFAPVNEQPAPADGEEVAASYGINDDAAEVLTLAQAATKIESEGQAVKIGNFETFADFLSYFRIHYRPMLERMQQEEHKERLLGFFIDDMLSAFADPEE